MSDKRKVVCAALNYDGLILCAPRHNDRVMAALIRAVWPEGDAPKFPRQGFVDQHGVFMDRKEALMVLGESGQPFYKGRNSRVDMLFSEGVY